MCLSSGFVLWPGNDFARWYQMRWTLVVVCSFGYNIYVYIYIYNGLDVMTLVHLCRACFQVLLHLGPSGCKCGQVVLLDLVPSNFYRHDPTCSFGFVWIFQALNSKHCLAKTLLHCLPTYGLWLVLHWSSWESRSFAWLSLSLSFCLRLSWLQRSKHGVQRLGGGLEARPRSIRVALFGSDRWNEGTDHVFTTRDHCGPLWCNGDLIGACGWQLEVRIGRT